MLVLLTLGLTGLSGSVYSQTSPVTLESLLHEMTDRTSLTIMPTYVCRQASSYDRASKSPEENWFANNDTSQFERVENQNGREEFVLIDAEGPGAIVRWWITAPHYKNNFYIYIDGATEPTISGRIDQIVGGDQLAGAPLSAETSRGRNLYLPIPYSKSIKVTCDNMSEQGNLYYHIDYRTYPSGTAVESFSPEVLSSEKELIASVNATLSSPWTTTRDCSDTRSIQGAKGHISSELLTERYDQRLLFGPGAITELRVKASAENLPAALRSVVLSISFDGEETVCAPLGDFFGSGVGVNPNCTWFSQTTEDGELISYWRMPYQHDAQISFINYGLEDVSIDYEVYYEKSPWTEQTMYFHSNWKQEREIQTVAGRGLCDWNYTTLDGQGVYVGDILSLVNRSSDWWGEGDEKIYVDGESFPSHFGTGTEDYYGYAWGSTAYFESPFHAQPRCEGPSNFGNTTVLRYRLLDGVPFTKSFKFDMEIWHWAQTTVDYAVTTFWYGLPGTKLTAEAQAALDNLEVEASSPVAYNNKFVFNFRDFQYEGTEGRDVVVQGMKGFEKEGHKWVDAKQLLWRSGKIGDEIVLTIKNAPKEAHEIVLGTTVARDYGVAAFYWNDAQLGEPVDFYVPEVVERRVVTLPLPANFNGEGALRVKIVGKNDASTNTLFGVDSIEWK
ncbi:MAG: DUF2961 domain-containing protein [Planctomycetia bacterium]|nr:DUF2961 domain-containing protein [Planctomycetia bacterium]